MKKEKPIFIDATKLSLDEWLDLMNSKKRESYNFVCYSFPTDSMREEYVSTIHNRSEREVIDLLRNFLFSSGSIGIDEHHFEYLLKQDKARFEKMMETEYFKRLLPGMFNDKKPVWEGNTWVIDLLPEHPKMAIDTLSAYIIAHVQVLPDGRWNGLEDAMVLIRTKFIQEPSTSILANLSPYQFERLVESLFVRMGYSTVLTQMTHDGGVDIIAKKEFTGEREITLIQCKTSKYKTTFKETRDLLGVVADRKANKGILISSTDFTSDAKKFQMRNPQLELINNKELQILLNTHFGSNWSAMVNIIIDLSIKKKKFAPS